MPSQLRIGVIGTSWWADGMLLPTLKSHPQAAVVALCGRNRDRAQPLAEKYAIPQIYADYREMYEMARLDAVVISTPDDTHYDMTLAALDANLHVLCEKPLALTVAQGKAMLDRAEAGGCKHMTYFTYRWLPHVRFLFELLNEGYLGTPFHGYFRWFMKYPEFAIDGWRAQPDRANGVLADLGSHLVDLARCTIGEIAQVNAHITHWPAHTDAGGRRLRQANDAALATLQFDNGAIGVVQVSSVAHTAGQWAGWQVVLHGEDGSLELSRAADGRLVLYGPRRAEAKSRVLSPPAHLLAGISPEHTENPPSSEIFTRQPVGCRLFIDAILEDRPLRPSFYDGLKAQQVIAAALESNRRGCWVEPSAVDDQSGYS